VVRVRSGPQVGLLSVNPAREPMWLLSLLEAERSDVASCSVGADQRQLKSWPGDQCNVGRMFLTPAQLEQITILLDRDGFPPSRPLAVVFGQHEVTPGAGKVIA
jgi:hypothetical protein